MASRIPGKEELSDSHCHQNKRTGQRGCTGNTHSINERGETTSRNPDHAHRLDRMRTLPGALIKRGGSQGNIEGGEKTNRGEVGSTGSGRKESSKFQA